MKSFWNHTAAAAAAAACGRKKTYKQNINISSNVNRCIHNRFMVISNECVGTDFICIFPFHSSLLHSPSIPTIERDIVFCAITCEGNGYCPVRCTVVLVADIYLDLAHVDRGNRAPFRSFCIHWHLTFFLCHIFFIHFNGHFVFIGISFGLSLRMFMRHTTDKIILS